MRLIAPWALVLIAVTLAPAERAGKVSRVLPAGFIIHQKVSTEAMDSAPVEWNDVVRTNAQGRMRIALEDQSLLTVGMNTEMRIVKHDAKTQQTVVEMLYGQMRSRVKKITVQGGSYNLRTPTAVIGVIGSEFAALVEREAPMTTSTVTREQIEQLPNQRSVASLLDLVPGAMPAATPTDQATLADFPANATRVFATDGITLVLNIDPNVKGALYLLPGEAAIIERGKPPRRFTPSSQADSPDSLQRAFFDAFPNCNNVLDLSQSGSAESPRYKIFGRGTSTGPAFELEIANPDPNCPLEVFVPNGMVLKPRGFVKRVIVGLLLGGNPPLKDFQLMLAEGGAFMADPRSSLPAGGMHFAVPESGKAAFTLRGFCLELHKLPPQSNTEYQVDHGKTRELGPHSQIISTVYRMANQGLLRPTAHHPDSIVQWSLWARREGMKENDFREEYTKLVEKNHKNQKKKWDKAAKANTEIQRKDLWDKVQKVLAETKPVN